MEHELVPGLDYPNTYGEFAELFPTEACTAFLAHLRWSHGFICPVCKTASTPWKEICGRLLCPNCHHQASITAGTIFDKTRIPLSIWFEAACHLTTSKSGMSAKRTLGIRTESRGQCCNVFGWPWLIPNVNRYLGTLK